MYAVIQKFIKYPLMPCNSFMSSERSAK